jgi:hypothetical protein
MNAAKPFRNWISAWLRGSVAPPGDRVFRLGSQESVNRMVGVKRVEHGHLYGRRHNMPLIDVPDPDVEDGDRGFGRLQCVKPGTVGRGRPREKPETLPEIA